MGNFTVQISLEVVADSDEDAMNQVAEALRAGYKGSGVAPIGVFNVAEGAPHLLDRVTKT